jgi:hypothetical protein
MAIRPTVFNSHVLVFDKSRITQTFAERRYKSGKRLGRPSVEKSDHRERRLLRAGSKRPRD